MISRSTILALVFACFATLSLAGAARVQRSNVALAAPPAPMAIHQLPRVVITGKAAKPAADQPAGH